MSRQSITRPSTAPSTLDPRFAASVRKSGSNELLSDVDSKFAASALKKIPSRGSLTELEQVRASLGEGKLRHLSKPWTPPAHYGNFKKPSSRLLDDEIAASGVLAPTANDAPPTSSRRKSRGAAAQGAARAVRLEHTDSALVSGCTYNKHPMRMVKTLQPCDSPLLRA